jgi:hypothetical protein
MPEIPARRPAVLPPVTVAALLLAAAPHLRALGLAEVHGGQVLAALGATKSRAYLLKARLEALLATLVGPTGRPPTPAPAPAPPSLATELLRYVADHAGAIRRGPDRHRYSHGFHVAVLELREQHPDVSLAAFAEATTIPLGTLKDWLRGEATAVDTEPTAPSPPPLEPTGPQLKTLLAEWALWHGPFLAFCEHAQKHCRLPFGRHHIATILEASGVRLPKRRPGRSPDEDALRGAFATYFPHAQWVGDGTVIPVELDGELFAFNLELDVDAYSGALVGAHVSEVEDSDAVIAAFRDAIASTGERPLALLLDNKPCNHTDDVHAELGDDTLLLPATRHRAQNKAHVEGAFGLLKPTLEGLALDAEGSRRDLARSFLENLVLAVGRAINHRPRRDRAGRSRAALLADAPTPEVVERARRDLQALLERQRKARETLAARQDPVVRERIAAALERLALADPRGTYLTAIARYPLDSVVDGIAIYEAKQRRGTLPDGVDVRYLLGIVRNVAHERESWELAEALWAERTAARDSVATYLERQRAAVVAALDAPQNLVAAYIERALLPAGRLERFFWLAATAELITQHRPEGLYRAATRRIAAAYSVDPRQRALAIRFLASEVRPLS